MIRRKRGGRPGWSWAVREQVKEECRDARGTRWLEELWQDLRYALRTLRQKPGFAAVALLTLALGSGATTVMFTVINGVLLKPFPYAESGPTGEIAGADGLEHAVRQSCGLHVSELSGLQAREPLSGNGGVPLQRRHAERAGRRRIRECLRGLVRIFSVLGVPLFRGRDFLAEEDRPGGAPVAIISYGVWQRRFGGSAAAIGMPLVFDGKSYTVVGVMPAEFRLGRTRRMCLLCSARTLRRSCRIARRTALVFGRGLRPGATLAQARGGAGGDRPRSGASNIRNRIRAAASSRSRFVRMWGTCGPRCGCCWARSAWCC